MDIKKKIKDIEKEEARLARKKQQLAQRLKAEKALDSKLETIVKNSGFKTPRALVVALIEKYGIRITKKMTSDAPVKERRKRTKVTAALRDTIKKDVKGGMSMNAASKKHNISYAVVSKIVKGAYNKLK